jgi:hypothetical protein
MYPLYIKMDTIRIQKKTQKNPKIKIANNETLIAVIKRL